jgi:hypothetical protein
MQRRSSAGIADGCQLPAAGCQLSALSFWLSAFGSTLRLSACLYSQAFKKKDRREAPILVEPAAVSRQPEADSRVSTLAADP